MAMMGAHIFRIYNIRGSSIPAQEIGIMSKSKLSTASHANIPCSGGPQTKPMESTAANNWRKPRICPVIMKILKRFGSSTTMVPLANQYPVNNKAEKSRIAITTQTKSAAWHATQASFCGWKPVSHEAQAISLLSRLVPHSPAAPPGQCSADGQRQTSSGRFHKDIYSGRSLGTTRPPPVTRRARSNNSNNNEWYYY